MFDTPSPFFAICPWLLADEDMGGSGWPFDAWHGWAYTEKYGRKKPVITALQQVRAKEIEPRSEPPPEPLPEPPPVPPPEWEMMVEYRPGARIIAGTLPRAGIQVTVTDPWANASTVVSGCKPEYGPGGFEVLAPHLVTYTVSFLDQTFEVRTKDGACIVTFVQVEPPPEPPPVPSPEPSSQAPPEPPPEPPRDKLALVFQMLDRIKEVIAQLVRDFESL